MKKTYFIFIVLILLVFSVYAQSKDDSKIRDKMNKQAPPQTVWLKDNLYFDVNEIKNIDYLEYLHWTKTNFGKESKIYEEAFPDTMVWAEYSGTYAPLIFRYLQKETYYEYPVVGITPEQAINYCKWRSDRVMEYKMIDSEMITLEDLKDGKKRKQIDSMLQLFKPKYTFRLPTEEEWMLAASYNLKKPVFPWEGTSIFDKKGNPKANCKISQGGGGETGMFKNFNLVYYSGYFDPSPIGLYDLAGNVAEIVMNSQELFDGFCLKGGSWEHSGFHCIIKSKDKYLFPTRYIGFRCICEVN